MDAKSKDLVVLNTLTPAAIFAPGGVQDVLDKIAREVRSIEKDISTKAGREAVAALAYKVARSKTALDKMGKDLGQEHYDAWKSITAERARISSELDALKDEVRKPLTDWENAEKDRVAGHEAAIAAFEAMLNFDTPPTAAKIMERIKALANREPRQWQEFVKKASDVIMRIERDLDIMHQVAKTHEAQIEELEMLRAQEIERQQKERDARIAAEAAEKARIEAEQKAAREAEAAARAAEAERNRIEREKAAALAKAAQAEADRKAAAEKAERDAKAAAEAADRRQAAAIEAERKRVADEAARMARETAAREADKAHRAKINNAAMAALEQILPSKDLAKAVITAIAKGEIPHIKIEY
jgi:colicin import membrane protein